ncbi:MAG TPA: (2Fe-2S)-binding protein [Myxococcota bacterium]|nr:(2Fe-2S)-binding protein [Myxococcota bacterium]
MPNVKLRVNGEARDVDVDPATPLLWVLRDQLGLTGAKYGCGLEQCGACAVLCDGKAVLSCSTAAASFAGREITTVEGLAAGGLDFVQRAFVAEQAAQCGYCIPGIVIAARALLDANPEPSDAQIRAALDTHLCRCGTHPRILRAVKRAARERALAR